MPQFRGPAAVLIALLSAALWTAHTWKPAPDVDPGAVVSADIPRVVAGDASGGDIPLPPEYATILPGARMIYRAYGPGPGAIQFLFVSGNAEAALHDPRQCMSGWRLSDPSTAHIPGTPITAQTFAGSQQGDRPDIEIAYFYVADGHFISSPSQIRTSILANALLGHRNAPIYFFRFVQPLGDPALNAQRHAHLLAFAAQMWQSLRPKIAPHATPS